MPEFANDTKMMMHFFSTPEKPCLLAEYKEFFMACSKEERAQYVADVKALYA